MKLLALESSTAYGGACLCIDQKFDEIATHKTRSHSEVLNLYVEELLTKHHTSLNDLEAIGVGIGPGSFTGIRVAFNCAKTIAYCFNKPLIAIDSLINLAHSNLSLVNSEATLITPMINAYKNMVYTATYRIHGTQIECLESPQVVRVQELSHFMKEKSWCVGDGFSAYEKYFSEDLRQKILRKPELVDFPTPQSCAELAAQKLNSKEKKFLLNWTEITPLYLRASEAEENKKGIKYQAL